MSSVCSVNSCTSPDVTSSNVSSNKMNEPLTNDAASGGGRLRTTVPEVKKDNKYWERRRRNNEAARRSREKRRVNDMNMDNRIMELAQRNKQLEQELYQIKVCVGPQTNTNSSANQVETCNKKPKLTPIVPAIEANTKDKIQTTLLNGMVFPIFTAIKPVINNAEISESKDVNGFTSSSSSCTISVQNDSNRFQTNLLTFSNIPLLSNLIATTNFNDDIVSKPTLLLPPFQVPSKTINETAACDSPLTSRVSDILGALNHTVPEVHKNSAEILHTINPVVVKTELQDVLDLRIKHVNGNSFFTVSEGFDTPIITSQADEPFNNSFLSGSVQPSHGKDHQTNPVTCNRTSDRCGYRTTRRPRPPSDKNFTTCRRLRKKPSDHLGNLRARLQIREEVASVVSKENRQLRDAINGLSEEIKQLKSVLLTIAASSVTNQLHLQPLYDVLKLERENNVDGPQ